jgi:hypothetical protein
VLVVCNGDLAVGRARCCCSDDCMSIDDSWDPLRRDSRTRWSLAVVAAGDIEVKCCSDEMSLW